ncbi:MAG: MBL fold metallo-hydrolase [Acidobacteriota bacterium]
MKSCCAIALSVILASVAVPAIAVDIAPGVELIPGQFIPSSQPDGNSVVFQGREGLVVVDTGRHSEHTQAIIDFAKAKNVPIGAVINTHWHLDHIGGNPAVRRAFPGVKVYASNALADARTTFLADEHKQLDEMIAKSSNVEEQKQWREELAIIDAGDARAPNVVVTRSGRQNLAGRKLEIHLESHAVTAGDVWVFDPKSGVLVSGDLVTLPVPFFDTACPQQWKASLDTLAGHDFKLLVPGHGPPMKRAEFELYRTAFDHLLECAGSAAAKETCIDGWMRDASSLIASEKPKWVRALMDYYIDSSLRGDSARNAKFCGR